MAAALTVDLNARIAQFETEMKRATSSLDKFGKKGDETAALLRRTFKGLAGGLTVGFAVRSFITETVNAQNEQAQLAAVIKSTGAAAGYTSDQLNKMASDLSGASIFDEGAITSAQTRLLSYTGIVGEQFPAAMQSVIDMSSRMGMSLEQSAETIGRALDIPSQGLTALQKQGFRFTDAQKELVEQLEKTGKVAEAQKIVLDALNSSYGGAARAARDTFGGALAALQNEFRSLATGSDELASRLKETTEGLTNTLRRVRELIDDGSGIPALIRLFAGVGKVPFDIVFGDIEIASTAQKRIEELRKELAELERVKADAKGSVLDVLFGTPKELDDKIAYTKQLIYLQTKFADKNFPQKAASPTGKTDAATETKKKTSKKADPLAGLLASTDIGRLEAFDKQVALLNQRFDGGRKNVELYSQAMTKLVESTFSANFSAGEKYLADQQRIADFDIAKIEAENDAIYEQSKAWTEAGKAIEDQYKPGLDQLNERLAYLDELFRRNLISAEALSAGYADAFDNVGESTKKAADEMDTFAKTAAKNIQNSFADFLFNPFENGLKGMAQSFGQMIQRMIADAVAADLTRKLFGENGGGGIAGGLLEGFGKLLGFENGGIMSSAGAIPLNRYAGGGIANSPQLALFGEGRMNEAYVPLPDGRSIPVKMQGGSGNTYITNVYGTNNAPDVRRAAGQGMREAIGFMNGARRYG